MTRSWINRWFTRPVTRTIHKAPRRVRPALEALEDRCVPTSLVNLLVTNDPLTLNFDASTYTSPNPAISGTLDNVSDNYFLNQTPSTGNVTLDGNIMLLNNAGSV